MSVPQIMTVDLEREAPGVYASYLIFSGDEVAVVDVGPAKTIDVLVDRLRRINRRVKVLITHIHLDHAGGIGHLVEEIEVEAVYVHPRAVKHLIDPSILWTSSIEVLGSQALKYGRPKPVPKELLKPLKDKEVITIGEHKIMAIYAEGHASHQVAYLLNDVLFPGDAVGEIYEGNVLILTPPPLLAGQAIATLDRFIRYNPKHLAVPHFGIYEDAVGLIKRYKAKLISHLKEAKLSIIQGSIERMKRYILEEEENKKALEILMSRGYGDPVEYAERCAKGLLEYVEKYGWD